MFCINYKNEDGEIVSYQEGPDEGGNNRPEGCSTITLDNKVPNMFNSNGHCVVKVDLATLQIVPR